MSLGIFSVATDGTMCPRVDSASKMSTRKTPGGEGGRCVRVTTSPPSQCRISRRSRSLNLLEPQQPHQTCSGKPLPFTFTFYSTYCIWEQAAVPMHRAKHCWHLATTCCHVCSLATARLAQFPRITLAVVWNWNNVSEWRRLSWMLRLVSGTHLTPTILPLT
jgi:hypothetical protein